MLKYLIIICYLTLAIKSNSQSIYSETVFSEKKQFEFDGVYYSSKVTVIDSLSKIKILLVEKKNTNKTLSFEFNFENLLLERYLTIYNSTILLSDDKSAYYFDLITNKRINTGIGNRYNEGMRVGLYNPVLKNGILKIYNYKLDLIESINLPIRMKNTINQELLESDVMNGKIYIIALVKYGRSNAQNKYLQYQYNIKTKKSYIK